MSWRKVSPIDRIKIQSNKTEISEGHPRFFLGSDSAPHPPHKKSTSTPTHACAAGIYTSPILLPLVAHLLESFEALDKLEGFVSDFGRSFYNQQIKGEAKSVVLRRSPGKVVDEQYMLGNDVLVPFWAGKAIRWEIAQWKSARQMAWKHYRHLIKRISNRSQMQSQLVNTVWGDSHPSKDASYCTLWEVASKWAGNSAYHSKQRVSVALS